MPRGSWYPLAVLRNFCLKADLKFDKAIHCVFYHVLIDMLLRADSKPKQA